MQPPSGSSMNFEIGQSSRATNIMQPECNSAYTPIPPWQIMFHPHTHQFQTWTTLHPLSNQMISLAMFIELIVVHQHQLVNTCIAYITKWNQVWIWCLAKMLKRIIHHYMIYQINTHVEIQDVIGDVLHVEQDTIMGIKYTNISSWIYSVKYRGSRALEVKGMTIRQSCKGVWESRGVTIRLSF